MKGDDVMDARAKLAARFKRSKTQKSESSNQLITDEEVKVESPSKPMRNWVRINDKVDAKAMNSVLVNEDESASQMNLEAEMEKYLGGDDEVLKGFYDSDDEIQFDSINPDSQVSTSGQSIFSRITGAF